MLPTKSLSRILDLLVSSLSVEADIVHNDIESDENEALQHHKQLLEMYGFLVQWTLAVVETKVAEKSQTTNAARRAAKAKDHPWDSTQQVQTALATMHKVLKLKLSRIFLTTADRDTFINCFTRSIYTMLENEQRVKHTSFRMHAFKVLCVAVKHHGHAFGTASPFLKKVTLIVQLTGMSRCPNCNHTESDVL